MVLLQTVCDEIDSSLKAFDKVYSTDFRDVVEAVSTLSQKKPDPYYIFK